MSKEFLAKEIFKLFGSGLMLFVCLYYNFSIETQIPWYLFKFCVFIFSVLSIVFYIRIKQILNYIKTQQQTTQNPNYSMSALFKDKDISPISKRQNHNFAQSGQTDEIY